jgi:hypothetical protein
MPTRTDPEERFHALEVAKAYGISVPFEHARNATSIRNYVAVELERQRYALAQASTDQFAREK